MAMVTTSTNDTTAAMKTNRPAIVQLTHIRIDNEGYKLSLPLHTAIPTLQVNGIIR